MDTVFVNATVLDVRAGRLIEDQEIAVRHGRITEVGTAVRRSGQLIDLQGRTVMPGLIDSHVHVTQGSESFAELKSWPASYAAIRSAQTLNDMLQRGFTTVRDLGGAEAGLARALREGLIVGPRLLFGGPILAPTGGHVLTRICDGPVELRRAIREQMVQGAHHIKLTLSGGVVSSMALDALAYSEEEIRAAVEEAGFAHGYVAGHAYSAASVNRALRYGVRTIEHGNLIDEESVELFKERDAFLVPTLATFDALRRSGAAHLTADGKGKLDAILERGLEALELADRAGVAIGYGTDLHGALHAHQLNEFTLRAEVQKPADILRSATVVGAEIAGLVGEIGEIRAGAWADLLVVDGNPLEDIAVLTEPDRRLRLIMQGGRIVKDTLAKEVPDVP
ncbi:metal-dependent hydrolase family protein [Kribbella shirazensis]|uniref:Imidazolonepropionase-like amidohydrolase n=1 Tax=Kribbella shirazensis TaxID=1105143 RepID=A0A7X6A270_9ACTN|nr:amidohydrolase family protein [Kribbella shirazensis]NIK58595.1 imidazolonepropionase-like amidohydrolase [Kribbella shirazensis]